MANVSTVSVEMMQPVQTTKVSATTNSKAIVSNGKGNEKATPGFAAVLTAEGDKNASVAGQEPQEVNDGSGISLLAGMFMVGLATIPTTINAATNTTDQSQPSVGTSVQAQTTSTAVWMQNQEALLVEPGQVTMSNVQTEMKKSPDGKAKGFQAMLEKMEPVNNEAVSQPLNVAITGMEQSSVSAKMQDATLNANVVSQESPQNLLNSNVQTLTTTQTQADPKGAESMAEAVKATVQEQASVVQAAPSLQNTAALKPTVKMVEPVKESIKAVDEGIPVNSQVEMTSVIGDSKMKEEQGSDLTYSQGNLLEFTEDKKSESISAVDTSVKPSFEQVLGQKVVNPSVDVSVAATTKASQPVKDHYELIAQIVDKTQVLTSANNTEIIIQLKPEHLGELTLKVTVEAGVVNASFHTNNPEVRGIIEASLTQLKQDMSNQGLKVDNVGVYAGLGQFLSDGHQDAQRQQQYNQIKVSSKKTEQDFIEAIDGASTVQTSAEADGVDYRV